MSYPFSQSMIIAPSRISHCCHQQLPGRSPKREILYDLFSHSVKAAVRHSSTSVGWLAWILRSKAGFSLRAIPTPFQLCATSSSSRLTSIRSSMSAQRSTRLSGLCTCMKYMSTLTPITTCLQSYLPSVCSSVDVAVDGYEEAEAEGCGVPVIES